MSDQQLRDLLAERVSDVRPTDLGPDLGETAWARGRSVRRRRHGVALVAAVALVAVGLGAVVGLESRTREADPARGAGSTYAGYPAVSGPTTEEEAALSQLSSPLPATLRLDAPATGDLGGGPALLAVALVAGQEVTSLRLLDADGRWVDVAPPATLRPVDGQPPVPDQLLSPDGRWVLLPQDGEALLYDVAAGEWASVDTGTTYGLGARWAGEETFAVPLTSEATSGQRTFQVPGRIASLPFSSTRDVRAPDGGEPYGAPYVDGGPFDQPAQAQGVAGLDGGVGTAGLDKVLVEEAGDPVERTWLTLASTPEDPRGERCCPVVGWLDADTVVYRSDGAEGTRLVAWRVGTSDLRRVSLLEGAGEQSVRLGLRAPARD